MSFVFYAIEATGTEIFFNQILKFAAIQTDTDLKETDRFEFHCRLLPHVVPAFECIGGKRVSELIDPSSPSHYQMMRSVRAKLSSWSPAIFIGWNSIESFEKLLRQALYITLHNPYLTTRDGNRRSDLMRIIQACRIFSPEALTFPANGRGELIFDLNHMAHANGFETNGHSGVVRDVEALIFLSKIVVENAPQIWSSFMRFSNKASVIDYISEERLFCVSDFFFGKPHSFIATAIGQGRDNNAEWYLYNLAISPEILSSLPEAQLANRVQQSPKPVRKLKTNAAPTLFPVEDATHICQGPEQGMEELERRAEILKGDLSLRERLISAFESNKKTYPPSTHVEKQIYDSFFNEADEALMNAFHETEWPHRWSLVEKFQDPRLKTIGTQLFHLECPELLDKEVRRKHDVATAKRLLGQDNNTMWLTLPHALKQCEEMLKRVSAVESTFLLEHRQYLHERYQEALTHLNDGPIQSGE